MINLAGDNNADKTILEELYLAGVKPIAVNKENTEVPYSFIGKVGDWTFKRAWRYWVATSKKDVPGLPLADAIILHTTKHPTNDAILGDTVRAGGHAGGIYPNEYVSQPIYNAEFLKECKELGIETQSMKSMGLGDDEKEYPKLNYGEIAKLCNEGKIKSKRFVDCYHIDDQIGLNEFVKFLTKIENKK